MGGLSVLLLALAASVGPNGHVLLGALAPQEVRRALPVDAFVDLLPRLWVVFHEDKTQAMAFYLPVEGPGGRRPRAEGRASADAAPDLSIWLLSSGARYERLLPGLRVPRIFLYAPYYLRQGRLKPAVDMPLDVAQYFSTALLEAGLDLEPPEGLERRVADHGPEIPPGMRRSAYLSALSQFGADAFSVAGEIRRSLGRQRGAGKDPCKVVDHPATIFAQWGRIFTTVEYRGLYQPPGVRRWVPGPPLEPSDKKFLVDRVLGGFWTGDVRADFDLPCPR